MAQEKLITINVKNVSLKEIFNIIENQTPYRFSYRSVVLDADRNISISAENISVTTVLNQALKDRNLVLFHLKQSLFRTSKPAM